MDEILSEKKLHEYASMDMLQMIVDNYFEYREKREKAITDLLDNNDPDDKLQFRIHEYKGSLAHLGLIRVSDLLKNAEIDASVGNIESCQKRWDDFITIRDDDLRESIKAMNVILGEKGPVRIEKRHNFSL